MRRLCTICARGGSKGIENKNTRYLLGKPLISYSILQAQATKIFDSIAVSSDADNILDVARIYGTDFLIHRPYELATDEAPKLPAIQHCVAQVELITGLVYDTIVDLDATSPLRLSDDIIEVVKLLEYNKISNVITGSIARRSPYFNLVEVDEHGVVKLSKQPTKPIVRRQDSSKCYDLNASIYAWQREALFSSTEIILKDTALYIMPMDRSIDIDEELDFEYVEFILRKRNSALEVTGERLI